MRTVALLLMPAVAFGWGTETYRYQIRNDWDVTESYTVREFSDGSVKIQNDWNLLDSHTARPRADGSYRVTDDWNIFDSYTVRKK